MEKEASARTIDSKELEYIQLKLQTGDVVDVFLVLLHARHVVLEGDHLITSGGGVVSEELRQLLPVLGVFMDTKL